MLIIGYYIYDSYYVYNHVVDNDIKNYKPSHEIIENSSINDDMVAWITIYDTNIDFPVMQATNNLKYLNTDPYGNYSLSGSIFLDCRNDPTFKDEYSIIYGHHMEYGKMFGALDKFFEEDYFKSHNTGELIIGRNAEEIYNLKIFACMRCDSKNISVFTPGNSSLVLEEIRDNAIFCLNTPNNKRIVVLSTCSSEEVDERMLIFCYIY